jgi:hypothetical protein
MHDAVVKVGFQELEYRSMEGENTLVCVDINRKLEKPVTMKYTLENSSALDFGESTISMQHRMLMHCDVPIQITMSLEIVAHW